MLLCLHRKLTDGNESNPKSDGVFCQTSCTKGMYVRSTSEKGLCSFFFFFATCIQIPLQNAEETLLLLFPLQNPLLRCYSPLLFVPFIRQAEPSSVKARKHLYFFDVASSDVMEGPNRGRSGKSLCLAVGPNIHTGLRQPSIDTQRQSRLGERT
jgi:hypothetical protein